MFKYVDLQTQITKNQHTSSCHIIIIMTTAVAVIAISICGIMYKRYVFSIIWKCKIKNNTSYIYYLKKKKIMRRTVRSFQNTHGNRIWIKFCPSPTDVVSLYKWLQRFRYAHKINIFGGVFSTDFFICCKLIHFHNLWNFLKECRW